MPLREQADDCCLLYEIDGDLFVYGVKLGVEVSLLFYLLLSSAIYLLYSHALFRSYIGMSFATS
jgi:hypothetical protein